MIQDGFVAIVRRTYSFLEVEYGFRFLDGTQEVVRFGSTSSLLNIYWESVSLEVGIRIATIDEPKRKFNLGHIIALTNEELGWSYRDPDTRPPNTLEKALREVASKLLLYGRPALEGDREFFVRLREMSDHFVQRSATERRQRVIRRRADRSDPA